MIELLTGVAPLLRWAEGTEELNRLNPSEDTNNDRRWNLRLWNLADVRGPGDEDEFAAEEGEDYDPHLEVIEGLDEERYEERWRWLGPLIRITSFLVLIFFISAFIVPPAFRAVRGFVQEPPSPDYVNAVLVDGRALIFPQSEVRFSIVVPSGYSREDIPRLTAPVLKAMQSWESVLTPRIRFVPAQAAGGDDLLIRFVTDLQTAGMATLRPGPDYRPEIFLRLNLDTPLPPAAIQQTVACHELGHALGLWGHSDYDDDCMYPIAGRMTPSERDIRTVRILYGLDEVPQ